MSDAQQQQVTILGSTGSIGLNTLKVIAENPDSYRVFALSANTKLELMFEQCQRFCQSYAVMVDPAAAKALQDLLSRGGSRTHVLSGEKALLEIAAHDNCDIVMAAIVGGVGLMPTLRAAQAGKRVLLANKEALVMAGPLFMETVKRAGALLLPIDSEHNAIFQCLPIGANARFEDKNKQGVDKIVLTASGGPFLTSKAEELARVTPAQACEHPNWRMGPKISVDSATLMNKALEFIEASILFDLEPARIEVLIHPQSIVHSMVHYRDGSVLAQMGNPDMRTPIAHAMAWPNRIKSGVQALDLKELSSLDFSAVDKQRFPAILLGQEAVKAGGTAPVILNAANEIAVAAFLTNTLSFTQIPVIIERALNQQECRRADSIEEVLEADLEARNLTRHLISNCQ